MSAPRKSNSSSSRVGTSHDDSTVGLEAARTFRARSNSFINSNDLALREVYHSERDGVPRHMYPNPGGLHAPQEVKYMNDVERAATQKPLTNARVANTALAGLTPGRTVANNGDVIFTRRGSVPNLMMMQKESINRDGDYPLRSNHSTFSSGRPVANAGFLDFSPGGTLQRVELNSGHYGPTHASGVKLAMWAEKTGAFNPITVPIVDHGGHQVDVGHTARVATVNDWAETHPPRTRRKSI